MKKGKIVISAVTAMTIFVSTIGGTALASSGADSASDNIKKNLAGLTEEQVQTIRQLKDNSIKEAISQLVENENLTQEEADSMLNIFNEKSLHKEKDNLSEEQKPPKNDEDESNLTQDQRKKLNETTKTIYDEGLSKLVDDGTITQDQADQLLKFDNF